MRKTRQTVVMAAALMVAGLAAAQTDPVAIEVGGEQITRSQFMREFENNVGSRLGGDVTAAERQKALDEYVDLYAVFKAKMLDAERIGLDTLPSLRAELKKYRTELAAPYLIDSAALDELLRKAYERNQYSLCAAHILVGVGLDADPADTLQAYRHALELRGRVTDGGENFYAVAAEEARRQNKDARIRENEGYLGYFSVFDMVAPFEDAAYAMSVGEISMPVRTRFGYHIIWLIDRVPLHGRLDMAHIWLHARDSVTNRGRIDAMYSRIKNGEPFETVALGSDDRTTRDNGGLMPDAMLNNLPSEYIERLKTMKPGEVTEPFFTQYGWHIIKLVRCDTLAPFENMVPYYRQRMVRDGRGDVSRKMFAANCRSRYNMVDYTNVPVDRRGKKMKASLDEVVALVPDSVQRGTWSGTLEHELTDLRPLFEVGDRQYDARDLVKYINIKQRFASNLLDKKYYVRKMYEDFIDSMVVEYADSRLEAEYPEFAGLMEDYRRGLMIFEYNDRMIWTKAIKDSAGFADYYSRASITKRLDNPDDSVFFWNERARVVVLDIADSSLIGTAKAKKVLEKARKNNVGSNGMKDAMTKAIGKKADGKAVVSTTVDVVERGRQQLLDNAWWQPGVYVKPVGKGLRVMVVEDVMPRTLKQQNEARGYYLNEYQNEVERKLNKDLFERYNVKINRDVVGANAR